MKLPAGGTASGNDTSGVVTSTRRHTNPFLSNNLLIAQFQHRCQTLGKLQQRVNIDAFTWARKYLLRRNMTATLRSGALARAAVSMCGLAMLKLWRREQGLPEHARCSRGL